MNLIPMAAIYNEDLDIMEEVDDLKPVLDLTTKIDSPSSIDELYDVLYKEPTVLPSNNKVKIPCFQDIKKENYINRIPISIQLGGSTISVNVSDNPMETGSDGWTSMSDGRIRISNSHAGLPCSNDYMEATYYHELTHAILMTMGKFELNKDEEFVEGFGNLLHQSIKTSKYDN